MTQTAEEALVALARDLVEEISAGRALELAMVQDPGQPAVSPTLVVKPKTGASAVHPHLGHHLVKLPGDTISGHAHAHAFKPLPVHAPDQREVALGAAQQALAMHQEEETARLQADQAAARAAHTGIPEPGTYAPLDDDQYAVHVSHAHQLVAAELAAGNATHKTETLDGRGQVWNPQRAAAHNEIVRHLAGQAASVPSEGRSMITGGISGAGKTTTLKQIPGADRHAVVSTDDIKEEMARRGMIPQVEGLSPMESSALVHEESGHVANLLAQHLAASRKNLAFDGHAASKDTVQKRLDWHRRNGYRDVQGVHVDAPAETAIERAGARHRRGLELYRQGKGHGARLVSPDLIRSAETAPGSTGSRETFSALQHKFSSWQLWDTGGDKPARAQAGGQPGEPGIMSVEDLIRQQDKKS